MQVSTEIPIKKHLTLYLDATVHPDGRFVGQCRMGTTRWRVGLADEFFRRIGGLAQLIPGLNSDLRLDIQREIEAFAAEAHQLVCPVPLHSVPLPQGTIRCAGGIRRQKLRVRVTLGEDGPIMGYAGPTGSKTFGLSRIPRDLCVEDQKSMILDILEGYPRGEESLITWTLLAYLIGCGATPFSRDQERDAALALSTGAHAEVVQPVIGTTRLSVLVCHTESGHTLALNIRPGSVARLSDASEEQLKHATLNGQVGPADMVAIMDALGRQDRPPMPRPAPQSAGRWGHLTRSSSTLSAFSRPS